MRGPCSRSPGFRPIASSLAIDSDNDGVPDACTADCDVDGVTDADEIGLLGAIDGDRDMMPDACEIAANPQLDRNNNGRVDSADLVWTPPEILTSRMVRWEQNPGDRHWYWISPDSWTFAQATAYASALGGHLAVITSPDENEFVRQAMVSKGVTFGWIGATTPANPTGFASFAWMTGERMTLARWQGTAPSGAASHIAALDQNGNWSAWTYYYNSRYIVEFDFRDCDGDEYLDEAERAQLGGDCDADNLLDSCAIAAGLAQDANGDGAPDRCALDCDSDGFCDFIEITMLGEADLDADAVPDACEIAANPALDGNSNGRLDLSDIAWVPPSSLTGIVRWQRVPGDNRWFYRVPSSRTYDLAKADAALLGGQLATLSTYRERQFFELLIPTNTTHWIGLERPCYDGSSLNFQWYTGEASRTTIPVNPISATACVNVPATISVSASGMSKGTFSSFPSSAIMDIMNPMILNIACSLTARSDG